MNSIFRTEFDTFIILIYFVKLYVPEPRSHDIYLYNETCSSSSGMKFYTQQSVSCQNDFLFISYFSYLFFAV